MVPFVLMTFLLLCFNTWADEFTKTSQEAIPVSVTMTALRQMQALQKKKQQQELESQHTDYKLQSLYSLPIASFAASTKPKILRYLPKIRACTYNESDTHVIVDIKAQVSRELLNTIEAEGGTIMTSFINYRTIRARVPLDKIASLNSRTDVLFISTAEQGFTAKQNTTEGDIAHNAIKGRQIYSVDGTGIKVGVISDSVDHLEQAIQQGDLPTNVTVVQDAAAVGAKGIGEGTAMLELN